MLNIATNRSINILSCTFVITERNIIKGRIGIVEAHVFHLERSAIFDITIHGINTKQSRILSERNKGCVDRHAPVVQFISVGHSKSERIRTGHNDLHSHHSKNIGKNRCRVDEILHQSNLIYEYVLASIFAQNIKVFCKLRHVVRRLYLDIRCLLYRKFSDHLEKQCRLARSAQAVKDTDLAVDIPCYKLLQECKAVPLFIFCYTTTKRLQTYSANDIGMKISRHRNS